METAHNSMMGGHLGIKKTTNRILSSFYWPGLRKDVTRFCRSCDICQKTVPKGTIPKAPLENMPIIDVPFKRVAVDLVGPFHPLSEKGHRYILTLELGVCQSKESIADVRYGQQLTLDQQQELQSVVSEYKHIFTDLPGTTDLIKHHVNVTCSDPVRSKPYPIPYRLREMLKNDIRDMLRMGVIRRSTSPYASPVVIVRKKDGSNRVCIVSEVE